MNGIVSAIEFPAIDPVLVRVGPVAIRWYGLAYLAGFALAYAGLRRLIHSGRLRLPPPQLSDLMAWLVVGVLAGGRLGWWAFYHRSQGAAEPWYEPLAIWHGGMSFHGGLIGVAVVLVAWCYLWRAPPWNVADAAALVAPVGLFFGRVANFINAELVGRPTGLPWGVLFPGDTVPRHPSQLYEALLEGLLLFLILWAVRTWCRPAEGRLAGLFLIGYGVLRFAVEFTRLPDEQVGFVAFGWLTMGQLLSLVLLLAGAATWWLRGGNVASSQNGGSLGGRREPQANRLGVHNYN